MSYVIREALAETITFAFEAADKMRYAQNLVGLILQLGDVLPGYSDAEARCLDERFGGTLVKLEFLGFPFW